MKKLLLALILLTFLLPPFGHTAEEKALLAGGCFWCMEKPFEELEGVQSVVSGFTGGDKKDPTYREVSAGVTGHTEAVRITFDNDVISYREILDTFWKQINPTDAGGQFADRGSQYRTGIFYYTEEQRKVAMQTKFELGFSEKFSSPIVTEIIPAGDFYPAEEYHQDYYKKKPNHYKAYRLGSGREGFLRKTWGKK